MRIGGLVGFPRGLAVAVASEVGVIDRKFVGVLRHWLCILRGEVVVWGWREAARDEEVLEKTRGGAGELTHEPQNTRTCCKPEHARLTGVAAACILGYDRSTDHNNKPNPNNQRSCNMIVSKLDKGKHHNATSLIISAVGT